MFYLSKKKQSVKRFAYRGEYEKVLQYYYTPND